MRCGLADDAMIERAADWQSLLAGIRAQRASGLEGAPDSVARAVLAGPCAIAWWIAKRDPRLAQRASLSILILGAESADAPDEGRWYQLMPTLLGAQFSTRVILVGLELDQEFRSSIAARAPAVPAEAHRCALDAFLQERGDTPIDLAFAFHPGLQKHRAWLEHDGFPKLLERATPLVCAAYESDEQEMERWVVEAYGYRADSQPLMNPFYLDLSDERTSIRWGRALWRIDAPPALDDIRNDERLRALDTLNRMVMHSMSEVAQAAPAYGAAVELASSAGAKWRLLHIADNRFIDPESAEVVQLESGSVRTLKKISPASIASYPGEVASEIERAVWAAGVKAECLLDTYAQKSRPQDSLVAATMLAALRQKIGAMFRDR